jgi:hypothetical protein
MKSTTPAEGAKKGDSVKKPKVLPFHSESLNKQLDDCIASTTDSCNHLFDLSLIVPSAPWVVFCHSLKGLKHDNI